MFDPKSINQKSRRRGQNARPGFTLVELLVALGLVSLLMLMFAQVFQSATGTMSTQRGIMENDQRARSITTVILNDLKFRSMRTVLPYQPGEAAPLSADLYPAYHSERFSTPHGFLSISENDTNLDNEDVLHFTAWVTDTSAQPFYGKSTQLAAIAGNPNQPDFDDGEIVPNSSGTSRMAEVVYFVRNGNLYRRVLLIREPIDTSSMNAQPRDGTNGDQNDFFAPANGYYNLGRDFWNEFDYSARFSTNTAGARFPGDGAPGVYNNPLNNAGGVGFFPLAVPRFRFGHNPDDAAGNENGSGVTASVGNPREFLGTTFLGRFTQEETSHAKFNFPHSLSSDADDHNTGTGIPTTLINDGNPMKINAGTNPLADADNDGVVDQYEQGPRRGEDILLTNVHGFDVKVWDDIIGDYVDVGHTLSSGGTNGDFHQNRNRRQTYGPLATGNRMFDTWHPGFNANATGGVDNDDNPPFLPKLNYGPTWAVNTGYAVGAIVVPATVATPNLESLAFVCTTAGTSDPTNEPTWPRIVGDTVTDGSVVWTSFYNLKRLKSIKITIRYLDVSSDLMRQVTLIQSLLD